MSPFAALGLDGSADERAVKRAYAQRLKTVRPDEDPEGFQVLHGAYKGALAAIRYRADLAAAETPELDGDQEPGEDDAVAPLRPMGNDERVAVDHLPQGVAALPDNEEEDFSLDVDRFLDDLLRVIADDTADLSAWLAEATSRWPLAVKPMVAPHVVASLLGTRPLMSPERLAAVTEAFGLDDVLSVTDPLTLEQLRRDTVRSWAHHEALERARVLLRPENGRELRTTMRAHGYPRLLTRAIVGLMLTKHAALWAAILRWFPYTTRPVMGLLRVVSEGAFDALSPPMDARAVERWRASERVRSKIRRWHYTSAVAAILLAIAHFAPPKNDHQAEPFDQGTADLLEEMGLSDTSPADERITAYRTFAVNHPPPWTSEVEAKVALATYNRGIDLEEAGRIGEAEEDYRDLDRTFEGSHVPDTRGLRGARPRQPVLPAGSDRRLQRCDRHRLQSPRAVRRLNRP